MSADPIVRLARQRIIKLSADLEVELSSLRGGGPIKEIWHRWRDRAAESLAAMVFLNIYDPKDRMKFVTLQNEVKRYDEIVGSLRDIISEGISYDREMTIEDREEMLDVLVQSPEGQRQAIELGLVDADSRDA
jgi:hypothetical protein